MPSTSEPKLSAAPADEREGDVLLRGRPFSVAMRTEKAMAARLIPVTLAAILLAVPARAQVLVDVSRVTCDEYAKGMLDDALLLSLWLSGYYHAKRNSTMVDLTNAKMSAQTLTRFCQENPQATVMQAADRLLAK